MSRVRSTVAKMMVGLTTAMLRLQYRVAVEPKPEVVMLAESIVDMGRMWQHEQPRPKLVFHVVDLSTSFRETPRTIIKALLLLESQGRARRSEHSALWRLEV